MKKKLKSKNGVTIVSLVVTIIILIILAGISINMTIGNNGILTIAKKAKENIELSQQEEEMKLNELYAQIEKETGTASEISYDIIAKLNNFKKAIADYIEAAGGIKPEYTADTETFGESIKGIVKEVTKDATATEEDIVEGKTAWVNGEKIVGTAVKSVLENEFKLAGTTRAANILHGSTLTLSNTGYKTITALSTSGNIQYIYIYDPDASYSSDSQKRRSVGVPIDVSSWNRIVLTANSRNDLPAFTNFYVTFKIE